MNRSLKRISLRQVALFGGMLATAATLSLIDPVLSGEANATLQDSPKTVLDEAWQIVNRDYVDGSFNRVDWQQVRQDLLSREYSSREQAYEALREALSQLQDPYTRFLDPEAFQALNDQTAGELSGVGLQLKRNDGDRAIEVVETIDRSPAARTSIQPGDRILSIDGQSTDAMSVEQAAHLIRGRVGTSVTLQLSRPEGTAFEVTLVRGRIQLPAAHATLKQEGDTQIGYIHLSEFSSHAPEQMHRAIRDLRDRGAEAFVLDLRGNPGGLFHASVQIARMWMDNGSIVRTVDRQGRSEEVEANRTALTQLPLAILVDGHSASASEILAGALQDNDRATVIGTTTFGKALVQSVHSLSDGSGLAVTIAHYYTPNGTDISQKGIAPDIAVTLTHQQRQQLQTNPSAIATDSDPYYTKALSFLETQSPAPIAVQ